MNPGERRTKIVESASRCFASCGYHATQISDIIKRAKIARGTFYLYFKSKHEIFDVILDDFIAHLQNQIWTIELGAGKNPSDQMRENVERVIDAILSRPEIGKILFNEAVGLDRTIDRKLKGFYGQLISIIETSISRGIPLGLVRDVHPRIAACIVMGGFRELLIQMTIFKNVKMDRGAIVDGLIDVLIGGMGGKLGVRE